MNTGTQHEKKRIRFGLLTDSTESSYHIDILSGITDFVREHDIDLFIFVGGVLQSANIYEYDRNKLYFLVNTNNVDGLLVLTPTLGLNIGPRGMRKILQSFSPLPVVSIATRLPDITSVVIDNKKGMRELLVHLIETHGCKRFACVRGPAHVPDAEERFMVFKEILKHCHLPLINELILQGPYGSNFGIKAVKALLDNRNTTFDAVISSNDDTALGVIEELKRRGIPVPGRIKVAGFDDIIDSRSFIPKLTTVHQPIYRIGHMACSTLYNIITGKKTKLLTKLPTEIVIRESCGCSYNERITNLVKNNEKNCMAGAKRLIIKEFKDLNLSNKYGLGEAGQDLSKHILDYFFNDDTIIRNKRSFLSSWKNFLQTAGVRQYNFSIIHRLYHMLQEHLFPLLYKADKPSELYELNAETEEILENVFLEWEMDQKIRNMDMEVKLRELYEELQTVHNLSQQMNRIFIGLLNIGIRDCFLSLFVNPTEPLNIARLMLACKNGKQLPLKEDESVFTSSKLVPGKNFIHGDARTTMIVSSLFYGEEQLGFILYNFFGWAPNPYEDLRMILSSAIKNALLSAKMKNMASDLELYDNHRSPLLAATMGSKEKLPDLRIQRAVDFINERYNTDINLKDAANRAFMAETYFSRVFKQVCGKGFLEYLTGLRLEKACSLLQNTGLKTSEIARFVGYHDPNYFYKIFKEAFGRTPTQFRRT